MEDAEKSTAFYRAVLAAEPTLDVPGMTEFALPGGAVLGLMPTSGIARLLSESIPDIREQPEVPRAELYLVVDDLEAAVARIITAGGVEVSAVQPRDWGDRAGYYRDPDGHVVALAAPTR